MSQPVGLEIDVSEVLEELDPLGRALFDTALARTQVRKLTERVAELEGRLATLEGAQT